MSFPDEDPEPRPPEHPHPGDCCGNGCEPCVFDLYDEALERYRRDLRVWRERNRERRKSLPNPGAASISRDDV